MKIRLNNRFYKKEAVEKALHDFRGICSGNILDDSIAVELIPKEDIDDLEHEFSNYVLGLMKNNMLM